MSQFARRLNRIRKKANNHYALLSFVIYNLKFYEEMRIIESGAFTSQTVILQKIDFHLNLKILRFLFLIILQKPIKQGHNRVACSKSALLLRTTRRADENTENTCFRQPGPKGSGPEGLHLIQLSPLHANPFLLSSIF